jgi:hypothetical protein
MTDNPPVEWTEIGWIEVDSATVGFGDDSCRGLLGSRLLDLHVGRGHAHGPILDFTLHGVPLIAFTTMEDRDYPVEVARDRAGRLLGARICLTTDVDELEDNRAGSWQPVGAVPIASATCLAADPFIDHLIYQRSFECPKGLFPVEVFEWPDPEHDSTVDRLGIRVRFGDRSALEHGERSRA